MAGDSAFRVTPLESARRVVSLDVVRGFAVLGILVMNIQSFSMPTAAYLNPTAFGDLQGVHYAVWWLSHLLADQKFITLFSLLFGAGMVMMSQRAAICGGVAGGLHYRRMLWLLVGGLLHAYLVWYGDILVTYALCGMLLFPLRHLPAWALCALSLILVAFGSAIGVGFGLSMPYWGADAVRAFSAENWAPPAEVLELEIRIYRGGWWGQMPHRVATALFLQTFLLLFGLLWRMGGVMLLGMALLKWGILTACRPAWVERGLLVAGLSAGLPLVLIGIWQNEAAGWDVTYAFYLGSQFNYWGSLLVSLGYLGAVLLWCRRFPTVWPSRALAAVGRMALTNYLLQSLLCTALFYGHGLGQFGRFSRTEQVLVVALIGLLQLAWSPLWLRHFRFGPCEWLWRSLTYGRLT